MGYIYCIYALYENVVVEAFYVSVPGMAMAMAIPCYPVVVVFCYR